MSGTNPAHTRLDTWLAFLNIDAETIEMLQHAGPVVLPHVDEVLDHFYLHLKDKELDRIFASPESMARARHAQKIHWQTHVLTGCYDQEYLANAKRIGDSHHRAGVDLPYYTSAYSLVLEKLTARIAHHYQDRPETGQAVMRAVNKAVFLDMGLAVSVYYEGMLNNMENLAHELNFSLARAGEFRDNETGLHLMRMSRMCSALALAIGKDPKWAEMIRVASPLHDVGKIGIPDTVLLKSGPLDAAEMEIMQSHPLIGGKIIPDHSAEVIRMARRISLTHHEQWDGSGYPAGLKGEEIPLEGRIAAICDVYDALSSKRPYKKAWEHDVVTAHMREGSGRHFDPELLETFLKILPEIDAIRELYAE